MRQHGWLQWPHTAAVQMAGWAAFCGNDYTMSRFRFVFAIFWLTGTSILAVYLRNANNRIFYELSMQTDKQRQLNKELADKQLRLERLINPSAVSERIER